MASERATTSAIESTRATPYLSRSSAPKASTRELLRSMSGLPPLKAQTMRAPGTRPGAAGPLKAWANFPEWDESVPITPILRSD